MSTDLLERMRALDPAADADLTPPEDLLTQLLDEWPAATPPRRPRRRRRRLALAVAGLAAAGVASVALVGKSGPSLAAQAYAQTSDAAGVLYVRARVESEGRVSTSESWLYRDRGRVHANFGADGWSDSVLRPDGTVRFRNGDGQDIVWEGPEAVTQREYLSRNFVGEFRRAYQQGTLDPAGTTTFAGQQAQRYVVDTSGIAPAVERLKLPAGTWTLHREFYVDAGRRHAARFDQRLHEHPAGEDRDAAHDRDRRGDRAPSPDSGEPRAA